MKILIIKTSSLGDIIHTFPVLEYLKHKFPACTIDWVVEKPFSGLLTSHPSIDRVIQVDTKKWRKAWFGKENRGEIGAFRRKLGVHQYDVVLDLQGNIKSGAITFLAKSPKKVGFGWKSVPEWPNVLMTNYRVNPPVGRNIREDYLYLVQQSFGDTLYRSNANMEGGGFRLSRLSDPDSRLIAQMTENEEFRHNRHVMVCPGANWQNKRVSTSTLSLFMLKVQKLISCNFLVIWGTPEEKRVAEEICNAVPSSSIIDRLPLPMLQNLMGQMALVIAMDSLPLHLAGTAGVPTYSVFGASLADKYQPIGTLHDSFQGECPYGRQFDKRCPILRTCKTGECIKGISPELLFDSFEKFWNRLNKV